LHPPDRVLTGADRDPALTDWRARYAELCETYSEDLPNNPSGA
jgi:hypothetical protein